MIAVRVSLLAVADCYHRRRTPTMADAPPPTDPVLDIHFRWHAGKVFLGLAVLLTLVGLVRPLAERSPTWLRATDALLLGLGVTGSALLASLKGRKFVPEKY